MLEFADGADRSTTADSAEVHPWTSEERHNYVRSLGIAAGPHEEAVLLLLEDAISDAPLPPPWVMCRDDVGHAFWWDQVNQESQWKHPLETALRELAGVCQACLSLDREGRVPCLMSLKTAWEQEAKGALDKWCRARDQDKEYFWHGESKEVTWTHPGEKILPSFYMKMKVLERLREGEGDGPSQTLETTLPPTGSSRYSFKDELSSLDHEVRKESLPSGVELSVLSGTAVEAGARSTGGWWWGCSPMNYLDAEASNRAYNKGASAGRQLYDGRGATAPLESSKASGEQTLQQPMAHTA